MKVELRLYPTLDDNRTESCGIFDSLEDAWHEAYIISAMSDYNLRDFFTTELENEADNRV